jgi:hypothetical protein
MYCQGDRENGKALSILGLALDILEDYVAQVER